MAECKWCGKKGIFVKVNSDGLCEICANSIYLDIKQNIKIIQESLDIIDKSKNIDTIISRYNLIIERAISLKKYEEKEIKTISPKPSELIEKIKRIKENLIIDNFKNSLKEIEEKDEILLPVKNKINEAKKLLEKLYEFKKELTNLDIIKDIETKIKMFIIDLQLKKYYDEARKYEFIGNKKKAIEKYKELLYVLKTDNIDDQLQQDKINEIENKILELSND